MVNHWEENQQNTVIDNDLWTPILNIVIPNKGFIALLVIQLFYEKKLTGKNLTQDYI